MKFIRKNTVIGFLFIIIVNTIFANNLDTSWVNTMFYRENVGVSLIPEFDDAYGVAFRDINQDGLPDLNVTRFRELNRLLINRTNNSFRDKTIRTGLGGNLTPIGYKI